MQTLTESIEQEQEGQDFKIATTSVKKDKGKKKSKNMKQTIVANSSITSSSRDVSTLSKASDKSKAGNEQADYQIRDDA